MLLSEAWKEMFSSKIQKENLLRDIVFGYTINGNNSWTDTDILLELPGCNYIQNARCIYVTLKNKSQGWIWVADDHSGNPMALYEEPLINSNMIERYIAISVVEDFVRRLIYNGACDIHFVEADRGWRWWNLVRTELLLNNDIWIDRDYIQKSLLRRYSYVQRLYESFCDRNWLSLRKSKTQLRIS